MEKVNFVEITRQNDLNAIRAIISLFNDKGITELDTSNTDEEFDDLEAYCFDDDCHSADNIKIDKIINRNGYLYLIDDSGIEHNTEDFHCGTMPYIYNAVYCYLCNN